MNKKKLMLIILSITMISVICLGVAGCNPNTISLKDEYDFSVDNVKQVGTLHYYDVSPYGFPSVLAIYAGDERINDIISAWENLIQNGVFTKTNKNRNLFETGKDSTYVIEFGNEKHIRLVCIKSYKDSVIVTLGGEQRYLIDADLCRPLMDAYRAITDDDIVL